MAAKTPLFQTHGTCMDLWVLDLDPFHLKPTDRSVGTRGGPRGGGTYQYWPTKISVYIKSEQTYCVLTLNKKIKRKTQISKFTNTIKSIQYFYNKNKLTIIYFIFTNNILTLQLIKKILWDFMMLLKQLLLL